MSGAFQKAGRKLAFGKLRKVRPLKSEDKGSIPLFRMEQPVPRGTSREGWQPRRNKTPLKEEDA